MLIIALTVGIVIAVGIIFMVIKSVVIKLISMTLLVIALVLVIALGSDMIKEKVKPITIDNNTVIVYHEGEEVEFKARQVRRLDVANGTEGGIVITFIVEGFSYPVKVGKFSYEWGLKNELNKKFSAVMNDATF